MYSAVKKRLEISTDESTRFSLHSPLPQQVTPSTRRNKFVVKLSPLSELSLITKPTMTLDSSATEIGSTTRLRSPRLAPIKLQAPLESSRSSISRHRQYNMMTEPDLIDEDENQKYFDEIFRKTDKEEIKGADEKPKETVGPRAIRDFYNHYKKLDKVRDQNIHRQIKDSNHTSFLVRSTELKLLPSKIGFVKEKGLNSSLEIK